MTQTVPRLVLASASPARLATLRAAGLHPEVVVSGVDEDAVDAESPAALALLLAELKCAAVAATVDGSVRSVAGTSESVLVIGCDSVLELDGSAYGKPVDAAEATARWRSMRGRQGVLHSGHGLRLVSGPDGTEKQVSAVGSTVVRFADVGDDEIDAYVATGEPLGVAGAFTLDGLGGAYVSGIDGDPHTVVGISLPLLRVLVGELGLRWHSLWQARLGGVTPPGGRAPVR